ncbi:UNVERIFIED_CONTAM: hypothetical protein K2H54_014224 [Gekko kuhli]
MASGKRPRDADNINTPATNRFTPLESLDEEGEEGGGIELLEGSVTSLRDSPQKVQCRVSGEEGKGAWDSLLDNQTTLIARTVRSIFVRIEAIANQVDQLRARMDDVVGLFQPKKCPDRDNGLRLHKLPQQIQTVVASNLPGDGLQMEEVGSDKRDHLVFQRKCIALTILGYPAPSKKAPDWTERWRCIDHLSRLFGLDKANIDLEKILQLTRVFENLTVKPLIRTRVKQCSKDPPTEGRTEPSKLQVKQLTHEEPNFSREALPCQMEANGGGYRSAPMEEQPMEVCLLNSSEEELLISFGDLIPVEQQAVCERLALTLKKLNDLSGIETTLQSRTSDSGRVETVKASNDLPIGAADVSPQQLPSHSSLVGGLTRSGPQPSSNGCVFRDQEGLLEQISMEQ